jgi:hypothetical protein
MQNYTPVVVWFCSTQATPGGHAMLLSMSFSTGRATLVRLAAHIANAKVYSCKSFNLLIIYFYIIFYHHGF